MKIFSTRSCLVFGLILLISAWIWNAPAPLQGIHQVRQADTLFAAWSYCEEGAEFLKPRVAHRGNGLGINIGEFPLASKVFSLPCELAGEWSESAVKGILFVILFLNVFLWGSFAKKEWPSTWPGWDWFLLIWIFTTQHLLHLTIALPDGLALSLIAASLLLLQQKRVLSSCVGLVFFTIAFGMRPYFIPLLFLVENRKWIAGIVFSCAIFYFVWFKWWILQSEFLYYATGITWPWMITAEEFPLILKALFEILVRDLPNFVGLFLCFMAWKNQGQRLLVFGLLASLGLILLLRAPMLISHHYYAGAAGIFFLLWMLQGLKPFLAKFSGKENFMAWSFLLIGVVNVQHHWHRQALAQSEEVQTALQSAHVGPEDKIAVYIGEGSASTPYLYWAKHTGWASYESQNPGGSICPQGAQWKMTKLEGKVQILPCSEIH